MSRWPMLCTVFFLSVTLQLGTEEIRAQQGGAIGGAAGGNASSEPGFSLSSRFQSNFSQFTGGSQAAGQTTAGAAAATSGVFGQAGAGQNRGGIGGIGGIGGLGGLGGIGGIGGLGFGNRNAMGGANQPGNTGQKTIRTRMRLGFEPPPVDTAAVSQSATKILNRVLSRGDETAVSVTVKVQQGTAILVGKVDSDHAKDLAGRLVMLEPGIEAVRNQLTVDLGEPTPGTLPTPSGADERP